MIVYFSKAKFHNLLLQFLLKQSEEKHSVTYFSIFYVTCNGKE